MVIITTVDMLKFLVIHLPGSNNNWLETMTKQLTVFRILTFILLPIASLFGVMDLMILPSALANPAILLIVFVLAAFVIYTFTSLRFLTKGIDIGRPCKPSLRDWIRVNAFASSFMGIMFLMNALSVFFCQRPPVAPNPGAVPRYTAQCSANAESWTVFEDHETGGMVHVIYQHRFDGAYLPQFPFIKTVPVFIWRTGILMKDFPLIFQ